MSCHHHRRDANPPIRHQVKDYFETVGFERWNKIYSDSDEVNGVSQAHDKRCEGKLRNTTAVAQYHAHDDSEAQIQNYITYASSPPPRSK